MSSQVLMNGSAKLVLLSPLRVKPFVGQPRTRFRGIAELAASILEIGQSTPVLVRPLENDPDFEVELIDGERRLRACIEAGVSIKAWVMDGITDDDTQYELSAVANFGHEDHDNLEVAEIIKRFKQRGKTTEQIARILGKSIAWVVQHYSLLNLHPKVQQMLVTPSDGEAAGEYQISFGLALLLVKLPQEAQLKTAKEIIAGQHSLVEARRHVLQVIRETGTRTGRIRRGAERSRSIESFVKHSQAVVGTLLDMRQDEFRLMFVGSTPAKRQELVGAIHRLRDELEQLAQCLGSVEAGTRKKAQ